MKSLVRTAYFITRNRYLPYTSSRQINIFQFYKENAKTPAQRKIKEELERGVNWEKRALMKDPSGKEFEAVREPTPVQFPPLPVTPSFFAGPAENKNKTFDEMITHSTCLLTIMGKPVFSKIFEDSWVIPLKQNFPDLPIVQLGLIEDPADRIFGFLLNFFLKRSLDPSTTAWRFYGTKAFDWRNSLKAKNSFNCYVFLIHKGSFYFRGVGKATDQELHELFSAINSITQPNKSLPADATKPTTATTGHNPAPLGSNADKSNQKTDKPAPIAPNPNPNPNPSPSKTFPNKTNKS